MIRSGWMNINMNTEHWRPKNQTPFRTIDKNCGKTFEFIFSFLFFSVVVLDSSPHGSPEYDNRTLHIGRVRVPSFEIGYYCYSNGISMRIQSKFHFATDFEHLNCSIEFDNKNYFMSIVHSFYCPRSNFIYVGTSSYKIMKMILAKIEFSKVFRVNLGLNSFALTIVWPFNNIASEMSDEKRINKKAFL